MLKYVETLVTFSEVPDEITLAINISNCPCHCEGCHSSYLAEDIGEELNDLTLNRLLIKNQGITCVAFMGGDSDPSEINEFARKLKVHTNLKVAWYSGRQELSKDIDTCVAFMGGDSDPSEINEFARKLKVHTNLKVAWYSGRQELSKDINIKNFDYIKLGPYIEELGPLNSKTTNQRFYGVLKINKLEEIYVLNDITYMFWNK